MSRRAVKMIIIVVAVSSVPMMLIVDCSHICSLYPSHIYFNAMEIDTGVLLRVVKVFHWVQGMKERLKRHG